MEAELEVAGLKILRLSLGVTRMDRIQYAYIRVTAQVERFGNRVGRQQKRFLDVVKEDTQRGWCDLKGG